MKKHFFLEGPIQEGKSTLLRKLIREHLPETGGFSSQRLLNDSGKTVGFRVVPAAEAMALTAAYLPELSNIFLHFDGEKTEAKPEVFANIAAKYLRENHGKKLILLDEIGGVELLDPEFREALYETLDGKIPCVGVLKLELSNRNMCRNPGIGNECTAEMLRLREALLDCFHADIVAFSRETAAEAEKSAKNFLDAVFASRMTKEIQYVGAL